MDRNLKTIGLVNLLTLLGVTAGSGALLRVCQASAAPPALVLLGVGTLCALISYFQMRLEERERIERLEQDELRRAAPGSALFSQEADTYPAQRAREQFERWFVPAFTLVLLGSVVGAIYWLAARTLPGGPPPIQQATLGMAIHGLFGLVLFLLGKYTAGIARLDDQRLLRPGASYLLLGAYLSFLLAVALAAAELGFPKVDQIAARALIGAMGVLALETLVALVLEAYRPRVKGQVARLVYDSRLIGLISQPENLVATAAHALDYQFGFKVSQTWLYRFFEQAIAWIILLQLGALLASTAFVIIEPNEQGLLERFGRPVAQRGVLEPGLHFKWPWPIDEVTRYRTREIQTVVVGAQEDKDAHAERTVVWAKSHIKDEFNLLVASREMALSGGVSTNRGEQSVPVNLLAVSVPIQYRITNLVSWAYGHADAHSLLQSLATREVVRYLANVDVGEIMGGGRLDAAGVLRERVQEEASRRDLGIQVVFLGLQHIHPPVKVVPQYEAVIGAVQEAETNVLAARAYKIERELAAEAEATNLLVRARSESARRVATAQAEGALFANQIAAQQAAPSVYLRRTYLDTLVRSTTNAQKIVLGVTNTQDIVQYNLEEKIASDLLDVLQRPQK